MNAAFLPVPPLPPGRPLLVVTGFMGTGKTTSGRVAASLLGLPFFDLDEVLERRAGRPVREVFASLGEPGFRSLERDVVADATRLSATIVATGGGASLDGPSFAALTRGAVVAVLTADPDDLERRLGAGSDRPLLQPDPTRRIRELLREREPLYAKKGEELATTSRSPGDVGRELAGRYRRWNRNEGGAATAITVRGPDGPYQVAIGSGVLHGLGARLRRVAGASDEAVVVIDRTVEPLLGDRISSALREGGFRSGPRVVLPPGESAKSLDVVAGVWETFRRRRLDRTAVVVAVGGGAALDAAGFAAATFARGVSLVNVPTTLLAMVDASLGGKVAIDHAGAKNLVGAFHHPILTVVDPTTVRSAPPVATRGGLAEIVKAAMLASPLVFEWLETSPLDETGLPENLEWLIEQAIRIKAAYVSGDATDRSARKALNLGHTFAHAVESASGFETSHGEAVAIGLVAAARLGATFGIGPEGLPERLSTLLGRLRLPVVPPEGLSGGAMLEAMTADKKRIGGQSVFVVPATGGARLLRDVDPRSALEALLPSEVSYRG
ncbi:bifunctional shikimate kinase/3-dehydroquinate synthase [soil metagenome]